MAVILVIFTGSFSGSCKIIQDPIGSCRFKDPTGSYQDPANREIKALKREEQTSRY